MKLSIAILFTLHAIASVAQTYRVKSLTVQDGLVGEQVYDVVQDEKGLIWMATNRGICNYDGLQIEHFTDSLPTQASSRLFLLAKNHVLATGDDDYGQFVARVFRENEWQNVPLPEKFKDTNKRAWTAYGQGDSFFLALFQSDSVFRIDLQTGAYAGVSTANVTGLINRMVFFDQRLYLLTRGGLYVESEGTWESLAIQNENLEKDITGIQFVDRDVAYVTGRSWLGVLRQGVIEQLPFKPQNDQTRMGNLVFNKRGFLFFRSEKHFYWYHLPTNSYQAFKTDHGDVNPSQSRLFFDREENLWITSMRGVHRIQSFRFAAFSRRDGMMENEVSTVAELEPDVYFLGGPNSYTIIDHNKVSSYWLPTSPGLNRIASSTIRNTNAGRELYFSAGTLGIGKLLPNHQVQWRQEATPVHLVSTIENSVWVYTNSGQLFELHGKTRMQLPAPYWYIRNLYRSEDGTLLTCSNDGFRWFDGEQWHRTHRPQNPRLYQTTCYAEIDGKRFIGTQAGLAELRGDSIVPAKLRGQEIKQSVFAILQVNDREIWMGTDEGIVVMKDDQMHRYGPGNGLLGYDVNRAALIQASTGEILIGTNAGLNIYDSRFDWKREQQFRPEILTIGSGGKSTSAGEAVKYDYNTSRAGVEIFFRSITFSDDEVRFRYRLSGFDNRWHLINSVDQRSVVYRNLPDGKFVFEIQSALGSGEWTDAVKSAMITVTPPYYSTWWFYVLVFGITLGVGYGINTSISQYSRNRKLQAMVNEKVEEIRVNEDKLRIALDNSKMGAWTYYLPDDRLTLTPRVYDILDLEHIESPSLDFILKSIHPDDRAVLDQKIQASLQAQESIDMEARLESSSRKVRWIHVKGKAINNGEGKPYMISGTVNEITRRKKLEADREKMIAELERTNQELDRFVYSASHDLSAPLKSVLGLINISKMSGSKEETTTYLTMMERSVNKLDAFIKDIISYSRNSRLEVVKEEVDLTELVNDVLDNFKFDEQYKTTEVTVLISPELRHTTADKQRMKIILNNLISNALKFRKRITEVPHQITIQALIKDGRRVMEVTDNGEGISEAHVRKIFEMFYRANDHVWGSGLGLYIAKETAERMGFTLEVNSTLGEGSTFRLREKLG